jgi:hypothetical protein
MTSDDPPENPTAKYHPPPSSKKGKLSLKSRVLLDGAEGSLTQVHREQPDSFLNFDEQEVDYIRARLCVQQPGFSLQSLSFKKGIAIVVAILSAERLESAASITDQLVEDVLLNVGCRIQVDRKGMIFYVFPSKKMLLLLGAALASAEKVFRVIQVILS